MALTDIQRHVCRLLAGNRLASGESYVAGGTALNDALAAARLSRDIDLFHDTDAALDVSWTRDRETLVAAGYDLRVIRERPGLVEAQVSQGSQEVLIEWARDSAFRFFPLVEHADFGLVLHPFDLATNKVLALAGRVEPRDWVDVILCSEQLQPLGYLAWAACGKDPGFSPPGLLNAASRASRYSYDELEGLAFAGAPPDAADLGRRWHRALEEAVRIVDALPAREVGTGVLTASGELFRGGRDQLERALPSAELLFHPGRIKGAFPRVRPKP
jgi:hypothetical protein